MITVAVITIAAAVAAATLLGAVRLLDRRHRRAIDGTEADALAPREAAAPPRLAVLARTRVGHGRTLVVVEVEGRRLLLGSTHGSWTALADLGRALPPKDPDAGAGDAIEAELNRALNSTRFRRGGRSR
jgi:hypothetical protein